MDSDILEFCGRKLLEVQIPLEAIYSCLMFCLEELDINKVPKSYNSIDEFWKDKGTRIIEESFDKKISNYGCDEVIH
jgi:hypothetical protein